MPTKLGLLILVVLTGLALPQEPRLSSFLRPKPNPNSSSDLFELLRDPDIAIELQLDPLLIEELSSKTIASVMNSLASAKTAPTKEEQVALVKDYVKNHNGKVTETLDELLSPDKILRLRQIAHRIEIGRIGYSAALSNGWFGENIKLSNQERDKIIDKISAVDSELEEKIQELKATAELRVFALLPPQAKKDATRLLGEPFNGILKTNGEISYRMHQIRTADKAKKSLESGADKKK